MFRFGLIIAAAIIVVDQASKLYLIDLMARHPGGIEVTSFFNLVMVWNRGVSFGMFAGDNMRWILVAITTVISVIVLLWLRKATNRMLATGLGLVLGGAIGNIIDRVRLGAVADFFDFDLIFMRWPAFNVADMAIVCGVILILLESLFQGRKSGKMPS
ncbi:signal peptidase II [uncultured Sneathiella sp.]|jgi:signal peptidase II|uniref:signal peptidase II n=1 Tax=uncultured Sneathiella sp. TaxID=879315 RepID=UPI0030D7EFB7|tara:strand:+ start:275 stop:748 length:474 start_codon:yes stop_codon:yes gene_type:complete